MCELLCPALCNVTQNQNSESHGRIYVYIKLKEMGSLLLNTISSDRWDGKRRSRAVGTSKACVFGVINYGPVYKCCRHGIGVLDATVFPGTNQMETEEAKLAPGVCSPLRAIPRGNRGCEPRGWVRVAQLCVQPHQNGRFFARRRGSDVLPFAL